MNNNNTEHLNEQQSAELSPRDMEAQTKELHTTKSNSKNVRKTNSKLDLPKNRLISKKQRNESYKKIISQAQKELPTSNRIFSKMVHNKLIEKVSDIIGCTIARPNAMLAGSIFAFVLTLITYITAKKIGYILSGFETIAAFIAGWIIGLIYDYLRILFTGNKD